MVAPTLKIQEIFEGHIIYVIFDKKTNIARFCSIIFILSFFSVILGIL